MTVNQRATEDISQLRRQTSKVDPCKEQAKILRTKQKLIRIGIALLLLGVVRGLNPSTQEIIRAPFRGIVSSIERPVELLDNIKAEYSRVFDTRTDICDKWGLTTDKNILNSSKSAAKCSFSGNALLLLFDVLFVASVYNVLRQMRQEQS